MPTSQLTKIPKRKGWLPDTHDSRDKPFAMIREAVIAAAVVSPNEDYEIDDKAVPPFDQLNESSCVVNAWTGAAMILQSLEAGDTARTMLSRQFLYWTARCLTGSQKTDGGTYLRSGAKALAATGICGETDWPYNPAKVVISPGEAAFMEASNNKIKGYYSLTVGGSDRLNDMEACIKVNHPVPFGTQVGQELEDYDGNPNTIFNAPSSSLGGHALLVVGVRRFSGVRSWKIRNSWSPSWGLGGYFWASDSYMSAPMTSDLWVATYMPQFIA